MDAVRNWGIAASALLIAGALAISFTAPETATPAGAQAFAQTAQAQPATHVAFLVRFRGGGPIARAQDLAARGQMARARRLVETQLARQDGLRGLCFDRFTLGGAEIVLRSCEPVARRERADVQRAWLRRLRAMSAVEYVDANAVASQSGAG